MNKLCYQILASMLPWGMTTRRALLTMPFGNFGQTYIYQMVEKLKKEKLIADRRVTTKTDGRSYHHPYLALTDAGLYALADYASKNDISIGTVAPGAIGYDFLAYIGKADNIPEVQTRPNSGILSLLREKEYEALFARAGMIALPFERPDLSRVLFWYTEKEKALGNPPNRVSALILGALRSWQDEQPKTVNKILLHPSAPIWFSARVIQSTAGQPSSAHHSFAAYDGVIWDGARYTVVYHAGPRGTAWAADANSRLCAFLDTTFRRYDFVHNAVVIYHTLYEWETLWTDPHSKRRHADGKMAFGKPFANVFVLPYSTNASVQLLLITKGGDSPIEKV